MSPLYPTHTHTHTHTHSSEFQQQSKQKRIHQRARETILLEDDWRWVKFRGEKTKQRIWEMGGQKPHIHTSTITHTSSPGWHRPRSVSTRTEYLISRDSPTNKKKLTQSKENQKQEDSEIREIGPSPPVFVCVIVCRCCVCDCVCVIVCGCVVVVMCGCVVVDVCVCVVSAHPFPIFFASFSPPGI